mmetsp:Transcript_7087/g.9806  ORF Transcript_7087/g.9806 Transcript_7087/m.9806 type:complete len:366 (+) Transcript_7087:10-1107(+)|eukprot:CAMPEP_0168548604 /NCGR_PEP_ID=MMETSP0413-20121227/4655_1 /TAXON_ID=136452 /ORGANISM="Filamoeba nolandi, Strain NC-AS-23-1" /LENGTH=365 /DNA_ID=CAMNT_0008578929 /DNA_START=78 /DNA_END=1175 /DNA_ORIENTATION=-
MAEIPSAQQLPDWLRELPSNTKLWIDTDIGNDIDDVLALIISMLLFGRERIVGISTTFYRPDNKARIAKLLLSEYHWDHIPVHAGVGIYDVEKDGHLLTSKYGPWPPQFKTPWDPASVSSKEALAYKQLFAGKWEGIKVEPNTAVEALRAAVNKYGSELVILSIGFPTNVAEVWDDIVKNKINRIVIMGGWFEDPNGNVLRLGYNTVIDLSASRKLLQQKDIPVLIVSSEFCKKFAITKTQYDELQEKGHRVGGRAISKAICEDMKVWMEGKVQKGSEGLIHIGDPIAAYLTYRPESISKTEPVNIEIHDYVEGVHMFHPDCKNYITVTKVDQSNIHVVKDVYDAPAMVKGLLELIHRSFDWKKF